MEILRKVMLVLSAAAFAVCELFLNLMGGIAFIMNNYENCGISLIIAVAAFAIALISAFFRKPAANIISIVFNIIGTVFYIYPLGILNGIPNAKIPRESIEVLTSRIYPSVLVTVFLAMVIFADFFSYERSAKRAENRQRRIAEKQRALTDDERII